MKAKEIAKRLDLGERTVRRWLASASFPEARKRRKKQSSFDGFAPYVLSRGPRRGAKWPLSGMRIKPQGYTGSSRMVYRYLETLKQAEVKTSANLHRLRKFSANTTVWLFVRDPKTLDEIEREDLASFCQASPTLKRAYHLIQDFLRRVHQREGERLDAWLAQVAQSGRARTSVICFWRAERQRGCESWPSAGRSLMGWSKGM